MRVSCPACAATYEVPDDLIGAGRRLRCARCGENWLAAPEAPPDGAALAGASGPETVTPGTPGPGPAPEAAPPPAAAPPPPAGREAMAPPPQRSRTRPPQVIDPPLPRSGDAAPPRRDQALLLAWAGTAAAVLALAAGLALFRAEVMAAWPPSQRLFIALGLGPEG